MWLFTKRDCLLPVSFTFSLQCIGYRKWELPSPLVPTASTSIAIRAAAISKRLISFDSKAPNGCVWRGKCLQVRFHEGSSEGCENRVKQIVAWCGDWQRSEWVSEWERERERAREREDLQVNRFPHAVISFQMQPFWYITGHLVLGSDPEFITYSFIAKVLRCLPGINM
jgi:hypothetical protein